MTATGSQKAVLSTRAHALSGTPSADSAARIRFRATNCKSIGAIALLLASLGCNQPNPIAAPPAKQKTTSGAAATATPRTETANGARAAPVSVGEPSPDEPVKAAMQLQPTAATAGDTVELTVLVRIARAHYLHAAETSGQQFEPVAITMALPDEIESLGDWQFPAPIKVHGQSLGYRDSIELKRSLRIGPGAKNQSLKLIAELKYQACNDELCWPPAKTDLSASLTIGSQSR